MSFSDRNSCHGEKFAIEGITPLANRRTIRCCRGNWTIVTISARDALRSSFDVNRMIALLVAAAVLWHSTAGCCAHHAHACSSGPAHLSSHVACEHDHHSSDPASQPCDDSPACHEGLCSFVMPEAPVTVELDDSQAVFDNCLLPRQLTASIAPAGPSFSVPFSVSRYQLHLALRVLLL